jgi:hypothetical protein
MGRVKDIYLELINEYGHVDDIPMDINLDDYIAKKKQDEQEEEERERNSNQ